MEYLTSLVTMDEKWISTYEPETKEQPKEWRHSSAPYPKEFKTQMLSSKVFTSLFCDKDGILLVDYLEKDATIKTKYCIALPGKLKQ
jgi:hypothetical protein